MAMATCVFTCNSWFCISRITCLIIFSGSSALSIRSLRFARTRVDTRSNSATIVLLSKFIQTDRPGGLSYQLHCRALGLVGGRRGLVPDLSHLREQLGHLHAGKA